MAELRSSVSTAAADPTWAAAVVQRALQRFAALPLDDAARPLLDGSAVASALSLAGGEPGRAGTRYQLLPPQGADPAALAGDVTVEDWVRGTARAEVREVGGPEPISATAEVTLVGPGAHMTLTGRGGPPSPVSWTAAVDLDRWWQCCGHPLPGDGPAPGSSGPAATGTGVIAGPGSGGLAGPGSSVIAAPGSGAPAAPATVDVVERWFRVRVALLPAAGPDGRWSTTVTVTVTGRSWARPLVAIGGVVAKRGLQQRLAALARGVAGELDRFLTEAVALSVDDAADLLLHAAAGRRPAGGELGEAGSALDA